MYREKTIELYFSVSYLIIVVIETDPFTKLLSLHQQLQFCLIENKLRLT